MIDASASVRQMSWPVTACLLGSAVALAIAPALMPDAYSWLSNTTSESAAQRLSGAWLARAGFVLFGLGVQWLAVVHRPHWGPWGFALHSMFAALMLSTAVFSHAPFQEGLPVDVLEDTLHSISATLMGFAFATGVVVVGMHRRPDPVRVRDVVAVVASVAIPLGMSIWPNAAGLLQRTMFLIAYGWYLAEAWSTGRRPARTDI